MSRNSFQVAAMVLASRKVVWLCLCLLRWTCDVDARPPLGLTHIDSPGNLEIIADTAYINVPGGVRTVSSSGEMGFISIAHPNLGSPTSVTRVVQGLDGELYAAANFGTVFDPVAAALFPLAAPTAPIVTWELARVRSVDSTLRTYGNLNVATLFLLDGSSHTLFTSNGTGSLVSATPSGYAFGDSDIPGTAGSSPAFWGPDGQFNGFLFESELPGTIRDRNDGDGFNVSNTFGDVILGIDIVTPPEPPGYNYYLREYSVLQSTDGTFIEEAHVIVSHSDFVVYDEYVNDGLYAFYPGIVPGFSDRALPLLDVFPELAAIDIGTIHDLASVEGYLYMTFSGADGTFLFGARDPSVAIPEPAGVVSCVLAFTACVCSARMHGTSRVRRPWG